MPQTDGRIRLETEAVVLGYAMSRLDSKYLSSRSLPSWRAAFKEAADALSSPWTTFKNLRDEFDPLHNNRRRGWHRRPLRPNRQRVLDELHEVSDEALMELVDRILKRDSEATGEAVDSLAGLSRVAHNVAERLLTGRRAEEFFQVHSNEIAGIPSIDLLDFRNAARGFDFGVRGQPERAVEVKGLKTLAGDIQFTDREWIEAGCRGLNYWLVVVGNIASAPTARVFKDPRSELDARCFHQRSVTAVWRSSVTLR